MEFEQEQLARLWAAILGKSAREIHGDNAEKVFQSAKLIAKRGRTITIQVPTDEIKDVLATQFNNILSHASREVLGFSVNIKLVVKANESPNFLRRLNSPPIKNQVFNSFAVGTTNKLAHLAAMKICDEPGDTFNPLTIYGGNGYGKTHLLNAIANEMKDRNLNVLRLNADKFITNYVNAVRQNTMREFRETFDQLNCLIIDEFPSFEGKKGTCNFFAHIVNDFILYGRQLVIASNKSISELNLSTMLKSRLASGLEVKIIPPNKKTRAAIFAQIAKLRQFPLSDEVLELLAEQRKLSIPQFNGVLREIIARTQLIGEEASLELVHEIVKVRINEQPIKPTVKQVIEAATSVMDVTKKELCSSSRQRSVVKARHAIIFMMKNDCDMSFAEIGDELGKRQRQVVQSAYKQFEKKLDNDVETAQLLKTVRERTYS